MKIILPVLILILFFLSCKQEQSSTKINKIEEASIESKDHSKRFEKIAHQTATGKTIDLIIEKRSNNLSDFTIVSVDFSNNNDSLSIKDSDPLQLSVIKDLDANGYDELYLITTSMGSGSYASIFGFASNQDLSLTPIYFPSISENDVQVDGPFYGYMGHDSIYFSDNRILRKYPIYKEGDPNCCPTGGNKMLSYKLLAGEASWKLEIEK